MTSYTSESSFLSSGGEGSDSGFSSFGSPPANNHFPGSATVTVIQEEEPLTHPLLSNLNKEVVVVDSLVSFSSLPRIGPTSPCGG